MGTKMNSSKDKKKMDNLSELQMLILFSFIIFSFLADYTSY